MTEILKALLIPFSGTTLGAACVFFLKENMSITVQRIFTGFAAGVMTAASVWSLLIPALEMEEERENFAWIPACVGFLGGIAFLLILDQIIPHLHQNSNEAEGIPSKLSKNIMLVLAVTIHNFPEGMAVGVTYAGLIYGHSGISSAAALALAIGIAIQNFPEGAIISMPLHGDGMGKGKAFGYGVLSGLAEPVGAVLTIFFASFFLPFLPYLLSFAAGAMIYVVVEELIPEMSNGKHSNIGTIAFAVGFAGMMVLDVALG